jgi:hypothetical protein
MELPPAPTRSAVTAARLNLDIGTDHFLVSILQKATTPRKDHWDLKSDASCLAWFYSHIKVPPRVQIDPWNALDINDFKPVDVSIPSVQSCTALVTNIRSINKRQAKRLLAENNPDQTSFTSLTTSNKTRGGTLSPTKIAAMLAAKRKRKRQWEQKMYPKTYVTPLKQIRVANSLNILIALRKLVRRRELHIKMMREAVELDWWRVISEDWKATIRLVTCNIIELVQVWREKLGPVEGQRPWSPITNQHPRAFLWKGKNYVLKIATDLDFMCKRSCYGSAQQRNPFLLPFPLEALYAIADAEQDQQSWGCRISSAAAYLLHEEERCGTYVWHNATSTLVKVPVPSLAQFNDIKNAFQRKAQHWSKRESERRGKSHAGSLTSAHRGSTAGTLGMLKSRGSGYSIGSSSRGGGESGSSASRDGTSRGTSRDGRNISRGRDIFTPGSFGGSIGGEDTLVLPQNPHTPQTLGFVASGGLLNTNTFNSNTSILKYITLYVLLHV